MDKRAILFGPNNHVEAYAAKNNLQDWVHANHPDSLAGLDPAQFEEPVFVGGILNDHGLAALNVWKAKMAGITPP
jgi:hypothetical protein